MSHGLLPEQFRDLEPFVGAWALETERERNRKCLASPVAEIQALYDAMVPRMEAVLEYLRQLPLTQTPEGAHALPEETMRLLYLTLALAEVTAVELYRQPGVIDGFDPARFVPDHEARGR